ncbi:MAG: hypothetical protein HQL91_03375 [Magnetococcales bacterium]|nr:hypothetical protein [Magnetococcales bacterium]
MKKNLLMIAMLLGMAAGAGTASATALSSEDLALPSKPLIMASADSVQIVDEDQATTIDKKKKKKKKAKKSKRQKTAGANDFGAGAGGNAGQWDTGGAR